MKNNKRTIFTIIMCLSFSTFLSAGELGYSLIPPVPYPLDNPWSKEKLELGKKLFFDPILSGDNSVSCSSCHKPELGWTDGLPKAVGSDKTTLRRNTPTILNSGFNRNQFWDGRATSLEEQAMTPILSPVEMNQNPEQLIKELEGIEEYRDLFHKAFGPSGTSLENVAKAIAIFERSLVSTTSAFDRYQSGDEKAMSPKALRGMKLFFGKAKCSICHNGPFFTDNQFHNIGVADAPSKKDIGRQAVTGELFHKGAFRTPGLRDLIITGPYMHNGELKTLEEVIEFYNIGGRSDENKSPFISEIGLNNIQKENLVEFLKSLLSNPDEKYLN